MGSNSIVIYLAVATLLIGCAGRNAGETKIVAQPQDTVYTQRAAMDVYDYDPVRALQIVDSAVIVGNLSPVRGDLVRAIVYSKTLAEARMKRDVISHHRHLPQCFRGRRR